MSLKYAILGFLGYSEFTGYDLKKMFDESIRHFWGADQSQIYRTLTQLEQAGFAHAEAIPQEGKPSKKVYRITPRGREKLRHWLDGPFPRSEVRDASLVQLFFSGEADDETILGNLEELADELRERLAEIEAIQVVEETDHYVPSARQAFFWSLTVEHGVHATQSRLGWVTQTIARIRRGEAPAVEGDNR